jgi:hypothetical protein
MGELNAAGLSSLNSNVAGVCIPAARCHLRLLVMRVVVSAPLRFRAYKMALSINHQERETTGRNY